MNEATKFPGILYTIIITHQENYTNCKIFVSHTSTGQRSEDRLNSEEQRYQKVDKLGVERAQREIEYRDAEHVPHREYAAEGALDKYTLGQYNRNVPMTTTEEAHEEDVTPQGFYATGAGSQDGLTYAVRPKAEMINKSRKAKST